MNIQLKNLAEVPTLDIGRKDAKVSNIEHDQQEDAMEALLNELEKLDDTIDMKIFENDRLKDEISKASAVLAVQRNKLTAATASCLDFQTKYEDIINKHKICFPN